MATEPARHFWRGCIIENGRRLEHCNCGRSYSRGGICPESPDASEDLIRAPHEERQDGVVGGHGGALRCSCGSRWYDPDLSCPSLEADLHAFSARAC